MSNLDMKNKWEKWHPKKVFLNNSKKKYYFFQDIGFLNETDFCTINKNKPNKPIKKLNELEQELNEKKYFLNIKKKLEDKEKEFNSLNDKLKNLCVDFESQIYLFEKTLFSRLLKTILIISSYIIGENVSINESILLKKVKKIIKDDNFFLNKLQLLIHPSNQQILEKILKKSKNNKWELVYNKNIDINSFKIQSENNDIDATIYARWKEVYRIILEEEER